LLTAWAGLPPLKSLFFSLAACWRNWRAFSVYGLAIIAVGLLLGLDMRQATDLAAENYRRQPDNPVLIATQAFALERNGRATEGLALIEKLPPQVLSLPEFSLYHVIILRACGQGERAHKLAHTLDRSLFLPEEVRLLP